MYTLNIHPDLIAPTEWHSSIYLGLVTTLLVIRPYLPVRSDRWKFLRETFLIGPAVLLYFLVRGLMHSKEDQSLANAERLIEIEQRMGIFVEGSMQNSALNYSSIVTIFNWIYIWGHWPFITVSAIWLWRNHRSGYETLRTAVLLSGGAGLVVFFLFPVAPPRFMLEYGFVDTVLDESQSYRILQPPALTNIYAAFPSLHVGWNLLVGLTLFTHTRSTGVRLLGLLSPIAMFFAILITANHYILDGLAGIVFGLTGLGLALALRELQGRSKISDPTRPTTAHVSR